MPNGDDSRPRSGIIDTVLLLGPPIFLKEDAGDEIAAELKRWYREVPATWQGHDHNQTVVANRTLIYLTILALSDPTRPRPVDGALNQPGLRIEDVSCLLGHSSV
jgi:hypothetical protein